MKMKKSIKFFTVVGTTLSLACVAPLCVSTISCSSNKYPELKIERTILVGFKDGFVPPEGYHLVIPNFITKISTDAFKNCYTLSGTLTIPSSVIELASSCFRDCYGFTKLVFSPHSSLLTIGNQAFYNNDFSEGQLVLPNTVRSIGENAFERCYFSGDLVIPNSVTQIARGAFSFCENISSLTLPPDTQSIAKSAFEHCAFISTIIWNRNISLDTLTIGDNAFHLWNPAGGTIQATGSIDAAAIYAKLATGGLNASWNPAS